MITQYFDINARQIIQAPGTLAAAGPQTWVYGDNYNLAIYLTAAGIFQPIRTNDSLGLMLFQPGGTLPETNLAIIGTASILTDPIGNQYYQINVNLQTTGLADLVQVPNQSAKCQFHYVFTPGDGERFSSSADIPVTVNPDPTESSAGATPVPPGYPPNPNVFEIVQNKGRPSGYAPLDTTGRVPVANLPAATAGGDMMTSVYDPAKTGTVLTAQSAAAAPWAGISAKPSVFPPDPAIAETLAHKGAANGYAGLDANTLLLASEIPVDGTSITVVSGKITAPTAGVGDMLRSVYDPTHSGTVLSAAAAPWLGITGRPTTFPPPIATASVLGGVMPDGTSIAVNASGMISALAPGIGAHGCRYRNSATISYPSAGTIQALTFDTSVFDTDSYSASANPIGTTGRITIPVGQSGYYIVGGCVEWVITASQTFGFLAIQLNGGTNTYPVANQKMFIASPPQAYVMTVETVIHLNAGDYIQLVIQTNVAASLGSVYFNLPNFFAMRIA